MWKVKGEYRGRECDKVTECDKRQRYWALIAQVGNKQVEQDYQSENAEDRISKNGNIATRTII